MDIGLVQRLPKSVEVPPWSAIQSLHLPDTQISWTYWQSGTLCAQSAQEVWVNCSHCTAGGQRVRLGQLQRYLQEQ